VQLQSLLCVHYKVAWPSFPGVASCGKGVNCCLLAICLPGVVGVRHRRAAEQAGASSEGALKIMASCLPTSHRLKLSQRKPIRSYLNQLAPIHSMYSGTISGRESPPGMVSAPEHAALLCLQKMTEILSPVYYTGS